MKISFENIFFYFPESSTILIVTSSGDFGIDLSPEVINVNGKQCTQTPPQYPKNVWAAAGGFVDGIAIICGGEDRDTYEVLNECYALKSGGTQRQVNYS